MGVAYLDFSVFKYVSQVLGDSVIVAQILFSEIDCLLVAQDRSGVRLEELLFNTHVMVSDRQDCGSVLISLWGHRIIILLLIIIVRIALRVKLLRQHHLLKQDNGAHRVVKRQLVLVKLGQDGANVQMSVGLHLRSLKFRFDC
jgi:hypothetical protein